MNSKKATRRTALAAGLALALGLGMAAQASAGGSRTASGSPDDNITRIADFYGAYIDAESDLDNGGGKLARQLRAYYLTPAYLKKLTAWEDKNHADGVLQAQNTPPELEGHRQRHHRLHRGRHHPDLGRRRHHQARRRHDPYDPQDLPHRDEGHRRQVGLAKGPLAGS
ncbi:hypothetical protein ACRAWF_10055 [Streptomyces sp. L7]